MTTKGFISFIASEVAKNSYSNLDSGPYELGIKVLHWLRDERIQPDQVRAAITGLTVVSDDDGPPPTPEEVRRFQVYSQPGVGGPADEWYALLRGTQGDPAAILDCGHVVYESEPFGWIYEINADDQSFSVRFDSGNRLTWPWSALPTDQRFLAEASQLGPVNF
jgi:hypothetical protein